MFDYIDSNRDGIITDQEFQLFEPLNRWSTAAKAWSNSGQTAAKPWSNSGQFSVRGVVFKPWSPARRPPLDAPLLPSSASVAGGCRTAAAVARRLGCRFRVGAQTQTALLLQTSAVFFGAQTAPSRARPPNYIYIY
jgi:hypothetical protein